VWWLCGGELRLGGSCLVVCSCGVVRCGVVLCLGLCSHGWYFPAVWLALSGLFLLVAFGCVWFYVRCIGVTDGKSF